MEKCFKLFLIMIWLSVATILVSSGFASFVLSRYLEQGGGHFFFWGVGVFFYMLAVFSEILLQFFFGQIFVHLWYLSGAILTAAWLGQGSLHFIASTHWATRVTSRVLVTASILAAIFITYLKVDIAGYNGEPIALVYQKVLPRPLWLKILTVSFNVYGTLLLVFAFLWVSFQFFFKNKKENEKPLAKISFKPWLAFSIFTAGTMIPAVGSALVKKGLVEFLSLSEFLGAVFMLLGYLLLVGTKKDKQPPLR